MEAKILPDGNLEITINEKSRKVLRSLKDEPGFNSDNFMYEWFESFVDNSEYEWIRPEEIGALTSAPILVIRQYHNEDGEELPGTHNQDFPIIKAWGFMDYQVISLQQRLLYDGRAVLICGN